jgi:hypothetical protein
MAPLFFSEGFLPQLVLHADRGKHLLQPPVLILKRFCLGNHRRIHAPIFGSPFVERRVPYHGLQANAWHSPRGGTPPLAWRKIARIWGSLYLVIFIQNLLVYLAEKILLLQPLLSGGITGAASIAC